MPGGFIYDFFYVMTIPAALAGGFMNLNFMLAGTASSNPVLYTLSILLLLAETNAGYLGIDRFVKNKTSQPVVKQGHPQAV